MLDAARAPRFIQGQPVFFDHADPELFYVFPGPPRVALSADTGAPEVSLAMFRSHDGPSGGLLGFTAELSLTDAQHAYIRRVLMADGVRRPRVVVPAWRSGTARLAGWIGDDTSDDWAQHSLASTQPSLHPDGRATFSALLTPDGAALAHGALTGGGLPVAVMYELETLGLTGPLGIEIEADLHRTWQRLTIEADIKSRYYVRAGARGVFEEAVRQGEVRVRVVDESGDVDARTSTALQLAGEQFVMSLFTATPVPPERAGLDRTTTMNLEVGFMLRREREVAGKTFVWSYMERAAAPVRHHTSSSLAWMVAGREDEVTIRELDGDDVSFQHTQLEVVPSVPPSDAGLRAVVVEVTWDEAVVAEAGDVSASDAEVSGDVVAGEIQSCTLDADQPRHMLRSEHGIWAPWWYRAEGLAASVEGAEVRVSTDWQQGHGGVLVVPVDVLFQRERRLVMLGRFEDDWMRHVRLDVTHADGREETVLLDPTTDRHAWWVAPGGAPPSVVATWEVELGQPARQTGPFPLSEDVLLLDPPYAPSLHVTVLPVVDAQIMVVSVSLWWEDPETGFRDEAQVEIIPPDAAPVTVSLRRPRGGHDHYGYRIVRFDADGAEHVDEGTSNAANLLVGYREDQVATADVILLMGSPGARGDLAVAIELVAIVDGVDVDTRTHVMEGDQDRATVLLRLPRDVEAQLEVRATRYLVDGTTTTEAASVVGGIAALMI